MNSKQTHRGVHRVPAVLAGCTVLGVFNGALALDDANDNKKIDQLVALPANGSGHPLAIAHWRLAGATTDRPGPTREITTPRGPAERVYENVAPESLFYSAVQPHQAGDDGSFWPGSGGPAAPMVVAPVHV